jgi:hypothetical protein
MALAAALRIVARIDEPIERGAGTADARGNGGGLSDGHRAAPQSTANAAGLDLDVDRVRRSRVSTGDHRALLRRNRALNAGVIALPFGSNELCDCLVDRTNPMGAPASYVYCTIPCTGTCPTGYECREASVAPMSVGTYCFRAQ